MISKKILKCLEHKEGGDTMKLYTVTYWFYSVLMTLVTVRNVISYCFKDKRFFVGRDILSYLGSFYLQCSQGHLNSSWKYLVWFYARCTLDFLPRADLFTDILVPAICITCAHCALCTMSATMSATLSTSMSATISTSMSATMSATAMLFRRFVNSHGR